MTTGRPLGVRLLAGLLTVYTASGFLLALRIAGDRDPRYQWWLIAAAAAAFGVACGVGALAVWRLEPRAPSVLAACAVLGAGLCLALPAAAPDDVATRAMWRASIQGAVLLLAFLLLAAWYVRGVLRRRT